MTKIVYIEHRGTRHEVDVPTGWSVMEGAVKNGIPGIDADCGGQCACATCHIMVDPAWIAQTGARSEMENTMLEMVENRTETSRLSCQIKVTEALDGMVVRLPAAQH